jgi:hypothetical protein
MIWLIILIIIAGALLIKLGALSVLVTVLVVSLKVVIGLIMAVCLREHGRTLSVPLISLKTL